MMKLKVVVDNVTIRCAMLLTNRYHQQTNTQPDVLPVLNQQRCSTEERLPI